MRKPFCSRRDVAIVIGQIPLLMDYEKDFNKLKHSKIFEALKKIPSRQGLHSNHSGLVLTPDIIHDN